MESKVESRNTSGLKQLVSDHVNSFDYFIQEGLHDMSTELQRIQVKMSGKRSEDTRLNSSHITISYAVFCLKKKKHKQQKQKQKQKK